LKVLQILPLVEGTLLAGMVEPAALFQEAVSVAEAAVVLACYPGCSACSTSAHGSDGINSQLYRAPDGALFCQEAVC